MAEVLIINYGMGNLWSIKHAFEFVGAKVFISNKAQDIIKADQIVLPGVGSFKMAMEQILKNNIKDALSESVIVKKKKILGICLGMQLFGSLSTEDQITPGLNYVPNKIDKFKLESSKEKFKIPHIGFNTVEFKKNNGLFKDLEQSEDFYFVHSYRMMVENMDCNFGLCDYGEKFIAAFENDNIFGTQFHPEKSQTNGLKIIKNFLLL